MREATGAGAVWLFWEKVRRAVGSGRCVGDFVGGLGGSTRWEQLTLGTAVGGTLRYAVGISNGDTVGGHPWI